MIKILRLSAPPELTPEVVANKTALFMSDPSKAVWKEPYIVSRLMEMSHDKCCYCECRLGEESAYMEVEHFHHKNKYPAEVVIWENLLPSCRACNASKGPHDTIAKPIVNPCIDNPKDHLGFRNYRFKGKTDKGKETIELLHLNNPEKRCKPRFSICNVLCLEVERILRYVSSLRPESGTQEKSKARNQVRELLELCQVDQIYTASKATTLINEADYAELIIKMQSLGLWTPDLIELDAQMRGAALDSI